MVIRLISGFLVRVQAGEPLRGGVMAAQETLNLLVLVRVQASELNILKETGKETFKTICFLNLVCV